MMLSHHKFPKHDQRGVTLLLAILILSAITAIVFSMAAIALNEVKTSADLAKTEPVIKAAEGSAEDSLFKMIRGYSTLVDCSGAPSTSMLGGVTVNSCASSYLTNPYTFDLDPSTQMTFYMINPISQTSDPGYTSVQVTLRSGSTGTVYFCVFETADCVSTPSSTKALSMSDATWSSGALNPAQAYQLIVSNGAGATANYSVTSAPTGLPSGTTTIENTGSRQGVTRKLRIIIP
jgi:hypothetical protein